MIRRLRSDARKQRIRGWISAAIGAGLIYTVICILTGFEDLAPLWQGFFLLVLAWIFCENAFDNWKEAKNLRRMADHATENEDGHVIINLKEE